MEPRPMMDRLEAVFSIVPKAHAIADIGTDHGYLAVELINRQRAEYVIAGDVHKDPLESARAYVESCGLAAKVDCRLGDGLKMTEKGELNGAIVVDGWLLNARYYRCRTRTIRVLCTPTTEWTKRITSIHGSKGICYRSRNHRRRCW